MDSVLDSAPNLVIVHVPDMEAARRFYTETLGFTVQTDTDGFIQFGTPDGCAYAVVPEMPEQGETGTELWWFVDDADALHSTLQRQGVTVVSPPKDEPFGRAFSIKDPGGNTLSLLQLPAGAAQTTS